jgi:agenet domain-containing protein
MASSLSKLQSAYKKTFKTGTILEASFDEEGLRGSWYTAKVTRPLSRITHKIQVKFLNLSKNEYSSQPLCESVDAILVRPLPPLDPHGKFSLMDDVDVFHNEGWWEGVVTNISVIESTSIHLYSVFFRCSREQIDFPPHEIRLHREWISGNLWVPPLEPPCASSSGSVFLAFISVVDLIHG